MVSSDFIHEARRPAIYEVSPGTENVPGKTCILRARAVSGVTPNPLHQLFHFSFGVYISAFFYDL